VPLLTFIVSAAGGGTSNGASFSSVARTPTRTSKIEQAGYDVPMGRGERLQPAAKDGVDGGGTPLRLTDEEVSPLLGDANQLLGLSASGVFEVLRLGSRLSDVMLGHSLRLTDQPFGLQLSPFPLVSRVDLGLPQQSITLGAHLLTEGVSLGLLSHVGRQSRRWPAGSRPPAEQARAGSGCPSAAAWQRDDLVGGVGPPTLSLLTGQPKDLGQPLTDLLMDSLVDTFQRRGSIDAYALDLQPVRASRWARSRM
jgi:hypothetical protein